MGLAYFYDKDNENVVLVCTTSMTAFGPVFEDEALADAFCDWLGEDPRMRIRDLEDKLSEFRDCHVLDDCGEWYPAERCIHCNELVPDGPDADGIEARSPDNDGEWHARTCPTLKGILEAEAEERQHNP